MLDNYWVQDAFIGIYAPDQSYGSVILRMQLQGSNYCVQHALLPVLSTSLSAGQYSPIGDLYTAANIPIPTHAGAGSNLYFCLLNTENLQNALLLDDPSHPLTVVANIGAAESVVGSLGQGANWS